MNISMHVDVYGTETCWKRLWAILCPACNFVIFQQVFLKLGFDKGYPVFFQVDKAGGDQMGPMVRTIITIIIITIACI
jgi:hypothetical protein